VGMIWFAPATLFFAAAEALLVLAFVEYAGLARGSGVAIPVVPSGAAVLLTAAAFSGIVSVSLDVVLMSAFVTLAAMVLPLWRGGQDALASAAAAIFPAIYLGMSIGALI